MIEALILPQVLRDQIASEADAAYPNECCGLIEGIFKPSEANQSRTIQNTPSPNPLPQSGRGQNGETFPLPTTTEIHATACHPTHNIAAAKDRFEIDPARHIALLRALRGTDRSIVGCYHSHPDGRPEPSATDLESAADDDFVWLIAGSGTLAAFLHRNRAFRKLRLA